MGMRSDLVQECMKASVLQAKCRFTYRVIIIIITIIPFANDRDDDYAHL